MSCSSTGGVEHCHLLVSAMLQSEHQTTPTNIHSVTDTHHSLSHTQPARAHPPRVHTHHTRTLAENKDDSLQWQRRLYKDVFESFIGSVGTTTRDVVARARAVCQSSTTKRTKGYSSSSKKNPTRNTKSFSLQNR